VALLGGLDPVYTFDLGDAVAVRAAVRQAIADAGPGGGYVLGTGEAVAPNVPVESLIVAAQTAREHGVYGRDL
jgi:uroporphyrinogen-III decarboxylase